MWSNSCFLRSIRTRDRKTFITVITLGCIITAFLLAYTAFGEESPNFTTLQLVHIVFRHGEKNPSAMYPKDPNKDKKWFGGLGELTNRGKKQLYELGKTFRNRYKHFLSNSYSSKEVYMKSSYASRCQMSGMTLLAGLYPPIGPQIWNQELLWQPIPVNAVPRHIDNLIASKADCPAFTEEKMKSDQELFDRTSQTDRELFEYLSKHTGMAVTNISDVESLYGILLIEKENKLELPAWTETVFPDPMNTLAALNLASFTRTDLLKKLQAGPMLTEWVTHMKNKKDKNNDISKMYLYSGHDLTLVNCLSALQLLEPQFLPNFGAALAIELHSSHDHYEVKIFYYESSSTVDPRRLSIPGCSSPCALETFIELTEPLTSKNWVEECKILSH